MDFSEIGVTSRKTRITAKENVKRDEHNMEDLDEFFKDDERTFVAQQPVDPKTSASTNTSTSTNGRLMFDSVPTSHSGSRRRTPLLSPLTSKDNRSTHNSRPASAGRPATATDDDQFADALEEPVPSSSVGMDIDDESRGSIKVVNNIPLDDDFYDDGANFGMNDDDDIPVDMDRVLQQTPKLPRGTKLFVSPEPDSDEEYTHTDSRNKTFEERKLELERNTTVRASARKPYRENTSNQPRERTPTRLITSPLKSISHRLHSPLQPRLQNQSVSALTKSIATNRVGRVQPQQTYSPYDDGGFDNDIPAGRNVDSDSESEFEQIQTRPRSTKKMPPPRAKPSGSTTTTKRPVMATKAKARRAQAPRRKIIPRTSDDSDDDSEDQDYGPKRARGRTVSRVNKFQRTTRQPSVAEESPNKREHHIDVDRLRHDQESRASSRHPTEQPTRRSSRVRIPPLAFWRNERPVYARTKDSDVPTLREVVTVDEPVEKHYTRSRAASRRPSRSRVRSKSRSRTSRPPSRSRRRIDTLTDGDESRSEDDEEERAVTNGEVAGSEWLKQGFLKVDAYEGHGSDEKSKRLVAWAPGTENFSSEVITPEDNFKLAILFDKNREFIASGMMLIPPGGKKSLKSTDGTYFVFYCIQGVIQVTLSGKMFMIKKGCSLEVPMGNFYEFINKGKKDATLFFVQTRGQEVGDWDDDF